MATTATIPLVHHSHTHHDPIPSDPSAPWYLACLAKRSENASKIPVEWRLEGKSLPPKSRRNVIQVPRECGLLTTQELEITELGDVTELLRRLRTAQWTSVQVTTADAIAYAATLDAHLRTTSNPVGPFHGLPISIKDQFTVAGTECNMGWASWLVRDQAREDGGVTTEEEECDLVKTLKKQGAVLFARTNCPQSLMLGEGINWVYGRCLNPYQRELTTGGSSSGEGALLAMRGSPLGVGTDVGGSIRIPSSFTSLFGLKPTTRRLPYGKALNTFLGQEAIESALGPMSVDLGGVVEFARGLIQGRPWETDPQVIPMEWKEDKYLLRHLSPKLCFATYSFDTLIHPHPPILRALRITISALRAAGHEVIEWQPMDFKEQLEVLQRIWDSDGLEDVNRTVAASGEEILPNVKIELGIFEGVSVWESWQLNLAKYKYRAKFLRQWMSTVSQTSSGRPIDGIICPATATTAFLHDKALSFSYTAIANFWDIPALSMPITTVQAALDIQNPGFEPVSPLDQEVYDSYDPDRMEGSPVGIQVMGRRFEEEELLGVGKVIAEALKSYEGRN